jgi:hypothetical protein
VDAPLTGRPFPRKAFQTISDSLYRDVPIDADTVEQKVYPEASITVRRGTSPPVIWSCATNETSVDLDVAVGAIVVSSSWFSPHARLTSGLATIYCGLRHILAGQNGQT